jgi:ABC-type Fe3+/spermidine/putrescine transport system ATPase subunit
LDEPFTGLDQTLKLELQGDLRDLRMKYDFTSVLVSHSLEDVFSLADRLAVINNGQIIQLDSPNNVYQKPATHFVAKFVGQRNLIPGTVMGLSSDQELAYVLTGQGSTWLGRNLDKARRNEKVFYVISPEDIKFESSGLFKVDATFRAKETAGRREIYYLRLRNGSEIRVIAYLLDNGSSPRFAPGQMVEISWDPNQALVLKTE